MSAGPAAGGRPRIEAEDKVTGRAVYTGDAAEDGTAYAYLVQSTVAKGEIVELDAGAALALPGVLAVITHRDPPRLGPAGDEELRLLQSPRVAYRGQIVAIAIAERPEIARHAAGLVDVRYRTQPHATELRPDDPGLYRPDHVNPSYPTDTDQGDLDAVMGGDVEAAMSSAAVRLDQTYRTPAEHNNPMEPHAALAIWEGGRLTVYDSNQGSTVVRDALARLFDLDPARVRVITEHVGGGFGQKGTPRPVAVAAVIAARAVRRPVKLVSTRQQMFAFVGYRTPTVQRVRLAADGQGRLLGIGHDVIEQTSTVREFAEQTAVGTRMMYAAPARRTTHRLARLDVPTPAWMRAPGECPGMYALESAMDELAIACGLDPIELRIRNEPAVDPESGRPFSSRNLIACLRLGAERFGWAERDPSPGIRRHGRWLVGTGVAASAYPARRQPSKAVARADGQGYTVLINAADIGTGARTALTMIAAEALRAPLDRVRVRIGDSALPDAPLAGGSTGTASWGSAVDAACRRLRADLEARDLSVPPSGLEVAVDTAEELERDPASGYSTHAFGAQFVEAWVDADSGEVRVPRMLGVFAAGRIVNPTTARSQLVGGMIMGISMALLEESVMDHRLGLYLNHDLAQYHVAACADVGRIEAEWIDERDEHVNPIGVKGVGEIGIVGAAAAVANAVHHACGLRIRDLPILPGKIVAARR